MQWPPPGLNQRETTHALITRCYHQQISSADYRRCPCHFRVLTRPAAAFRHRNMLSTSSRLALLGPSSCPLSVTSSSSCSHNSLLASAESLVSRVLIPRIPAVSLLSSTPGNRAHWSLPSSPSLLASQPSSPPFSAPYPYPPSSIAPELKPLQRPRMVSHVSPLPIPASLYQRQTLSQFTLRPSLPPVTPRPVSGPSSWLAHGSHFTWAMPRICPPKRSRFLLEMVHHLPWRPRYC
jgi:hypothetical protein